MPTFSKQVLSGSTHGRPILVVATATPGTIIHTAQASTTNEDEIWLWAMNTDAAALKLTLEWGGVTVPDDLIEQLIPPEDGLHLLAPGIPLRNGLIVRAFAATTNLITISGFVNRIS